MAERSCGLVHATIEEAIVHAETEMGCRGRPMEPYWGTLEHNQRAVVGFKVSGRRRWRLDHDMANPAKGVHINVEDFDAPLADQRVVHPTTAHPLRAFHYWQKWTKHYEW